MTDHQFECLHILLIGIANDLSAILGLLEKQQAQTTDYEDQVKNYAKSIDSATSRLLGSVATASQALG